MAITGSCKKLNSNPSSVKSSDLATNGKHICVCNTTISYVDHCGEAANMTDTVFVSAINKSVANNICKQANVITSDSYTVTSKSCEIK